MPSTAFTHRSVVWDASRKSHKSPANSQVFIRPTYPQAFLRSFHPHSVISITVGFMLLYSCILLVTSVLSCSPLRQPHGSENSASKCANGCISFLPFSRVCVTIHFRATAANPSLIVLQAMVSQLVLGIRYVILSITKGNICDLNT